jgi:hypothetical protein
VEHVVLRARIEDHRRPRLLAEIEVLDQVSQQRQVLPDAGPGVRPAIGAGVEALVGEEIVPR